MITEHLGLVLVIMAAVGLVFLIAYLLSLATEFIRSGDFGAGVGFLLLILFMGFAIFFFMV